ncbi:MAG: hypothetical protein ABEK59_09910, partial [Halobacteria archaeon]
MELSLTFFRNTEKYFKIPGRVCLLGGVFGCIIVNAHPSQPERPSYLRAGYGGLLCLVADLFFVECVVVVVVEV